MKRVGPSGQRQVRLRHKTVESERVLPGSGLSGSPGGIEVFPRPEKIRIPIGSDRDIVKARQEGRRVAGELGFSSTDLVLVATAISELARNIVSYAKTGEIDIRPIVNSAHRGIEIIARDEGPGIRDVDRALQVGFSTSAGLGMGLPGVRRLMDEFKIQSNFGHGTVVITRKWKN